MSDNFNYENLTPFKWFVLENFPFIEADFDALTNWQLFCKLGNEINKLIESQNLVGEQVENLTNFVNNYFDNLNVQDEVDTKLDEMVQDGTLYNVINTQIFRDINEDIASLEQQLENTNTNLQGTSDQVATNSSRISNLENEIPNIVGGTPKGVYASLEALEEALPTGATGIYITADTGKWYYYLTGTGWTEGGVYQTGGIADGSITPAKLNALLKNSIQNTHIYPATNTVTKVDFNNSTKKYTISFNKTNIYIANQYMTGYSVIGVVAQTDLEIANGYALVVHKPTAFAGTPTNYTPILVQFSTFTSLADLFNDYIILWYNANGTLFGIMTNNLPINQNKLSTRKISISSSRITIFNKADAGWIGTAIKKVTSGSDSYIQFENSAVVNYNETTNNMSNTGKLLIYSGEWTAVIKEDFDGSDFVGGGHGHETIQDLQLLIDGSVYDITENLSLRDFNNVQILCKSNVYSLEDNELLCEKILLIDIQDTIKIKTKIIWKKATTILFEYLNMLPVSRYEHANSENPYVTNKGFNDVTLTPTTYADTSFTPTQYENATYFELYNNTIGYQFRASIKINNKTNITGNYGYVNNGSNANKVYFNYAPQHNTVSVNEVHETESEIKQYYSGLVES